MEDSRWDNFSNINPKLLLNWSLFILAVMSYFVNQFCLKPVSGNTIVQCYFNDFLAPILLIAYSNIIIFHYKMDWLLIERLNRIFLFIVPVSIWWEYITPLYKKSSTSDIYDILAYFIGALVYWCVLKIYNREGEDY